MIDRMNFSVYFFLVLLFASSVDAKSLSSTLDVYVFPKAGQDASQQSQDEAACYEWATNDTGNDPLNLQKKQTQNQQQAQIEKEAAKQTGRGAGVGGAVAGAVIGDIVDDSDGAKTGAAIGAIAARRKAKRVRSEAVNEVEKTAATTQQASAQQIENFKKAFSVCLEAKEYLVKF